MFDLEKMTTTTAFDVCAIDATLQDNRDGKIYKRTLYRPGKTYPKQLIYKEFAEFGYKVLRIGDPADVPGVINWSDVFGKFVQEEES